MVRIGNLGYLLYNPDILERDIGAATNDSQPGRRGSWRKQASALLAPAMGQKEQLWGVLVSPLFVEGHFPFI